MLLKTLETVYGAASRMPAMSLRWGTAHSAVLLAWGFTLSANISSRHLTRCDTAPVRRLTTSRQRWCATLRPAPATAA